MRSSVSSVRNTTASHSATMLSPHPSIDPDRTHASRGTNTRFISLRRSASGRFTAYGGSVGSQK